MAEKTVLEIYNEVELDGMRIDEEDYIEELKEKKKVMIVEDDRSLSMLTKEIVEMGGFSTILAYDGRQAVTKLKLLKKRYNLLPDFMLLDIYMPEPTGNKICKALKFEFKEFAEESGKREYAEYSEFPIFYCTGRPNDNEFKQIVEETGVNGFFIKGDYDLVELNRVIRDNIK